MDNLLIGRFFGAAAVGLYSRASILLIRPLEQFTIPINAVLVPALSRVQTEPERYRRTFLRVYEAMALISFLSTGLLLALARPLTLVVLGPKWEQAAPIFAGFSIAALCIPLAGASTWLFQTQGRGKDWLFASLLGSCITVASFVAGLPFGPVGVAIAYSVAGLFIGVPILYYFAGRQGPVTTADLWTRDFSLPSALDSCLRRDMAGAPPSRELPPVSAIGRLRSRWPSRWSDLNLSCTFNASSGVFAR